MPERERQKKEQLNSGRLPKSKNSSTPEQRESRPMSVRFNMQTGRVSEHVNIPQYQHTVRTYAPHLTEEDELVSKFVRTPEGRLPPPVKTQNMYTEH